MATVVNVKTPEVCDRCNAQAFWLYEHDDSGDLRFCGHHSSEYMPSLLSAGFSPALLVVRTSMEPVKPPAKV